MGERVKAEAQLSCSSNKSSTSHSELEAAQDPRAALEPIIIRHVIEWLRATGCRCTRLVYNRPNSRSTAGLKKPRPRSSCVTSAHGKDAMPRSECSLQRMYSHIQSRSSCSIAACSSKLASREFEPLLFFCLVFPRLPPYLRRKSLVFAHAPV